MRPGVTAKSALASRATAKSARTSQKKSSAQPKVVRARVDFDGRMHEIVFEHGPMTCGDTRRNCLDMAEDICALVDDRHPAAYKARWRGAKIIEVAIMPPTKNIWAK